MKGDIVFLSSKRYEFEKIGKTIFALTVAKIAERKGQKLDMIRNLNLICVRSEKTYSD